MSAFLTHLVDLYHKQPSKGSPLDLVSCLSDTKHILDRLFDSSGL